MVAEDDRAATPLYVVESEEPFESTEPVEADYMPEGLHEPEDHQEAEPEQAQVAEQLQEDPEFVMSPSSSTSTSSDSSAVAVAEKRKQPSRSSAASKKLRADSNVVSRLPRAAKVVGQRMLTASVHSDLRHEKRRSDKKASTDEPAERSKRARKVFAPAAPSVENAKLNYQFSTLHEVLSSLHGL